MARRLRSKKGAVQSSVSAPIRRKLHACFDHGERKPLEPLGAVYSGPTPLATPVYQPPDIEIWL